MEFNLNSRWAVITEINQVIIGKREVVKTGDNKGKPVIIRRWYYNNFEQALEGLIDRDIKELEKLEDLVARIEELKNDIKAMLKSTEKLHQRMSGKTSRVR